jgi:hypothetical protein
MAPARGERKGGLRLHQAPMHGEHFLIINKSEGND